MSSGKEWILFIEMTKTCRFYCNFIHGRETWYDRNFIYKNTVLLIIPFFITAMTWSMWYYVYCELLSMLHGTQNFNIFQINFCSIKIILTPTIKLQIYVSLGRPHIVLPMCVRLEERCSIMAALYNISFLYSICTIAWKTSHRRISQEPLDQWKAWL